PSPWRPSAFLAKVIRGAISSVGRAPRLHRGCRRFESVIAHHPASRYALRRICAPVGSRSRMPSEAFGEGGRLEALIVHVLLRATRFAGFCAPVGSRSRMPSEALAKEGGLDALRLPVGKRSGFRPTLYRRYVRPEAPPRGAQCREVSAHVQIRSLETG